MAKAKNSAGRLYSRKRLFDDEVRTFTGEQLKEISMPLGGIGTGCIGLGGRGELRDWEIFNGPNVGFSPDYTLPMLYLKWGRQKASRVLERRLLPPYTGYSGLPVTQFSGMPRMDEATFIGTYPFGRVVFHEERLPVEITLEAFNPMIPMSAEDSGIPAAVLTYRIANSSKSEVEGTIAWSMQNCVGLSVVEGERPKEPRGLGGNVNEYRADKTCRGLNMTNGKYAPSNLGYGSMALMTPHRNVTVATGWLEKGWWDKAQKVWDDFAADGRLDGPTTPTPASEDKQSHVGTLGVRFKLRGRETTTVTFVIAWNFPNHGIPTCHQSQIDAGLRNHYAARFADAWSAGKYVIENLPRLREQSRRFEQALLDTSVPGDVLEAVSSQMSILKSNTVMWLDSPANEPLGRIFAFEGCGDKGGCCPMNCTHVWNYEQTLAHLYPQLERTMRRTDFTHNLFDKGGMLFRTMLPIGGKAALGQWRPEFPAADGQFGTIIKLYRDWQISGDDAMLRELYGGMKKCLDFAQTGFAKWDADGDGVLEGVQHNTYDIDFHGPNTMIGGLYIAALKAGVEMARATGDEEAVERWSRLAERASRLYDKLLFRGGYYVQKVIDVPAGAKDNLGNVIGLPDKAHRPKYQQGAGCLSDQLLGQWAAHVAGLGYVLPAEHVQEAVRSIFKHNFKSDLSEHQSVQRTYGVNDEAGLLLCTWPNGKREKFPFPYSDEIWTGIEYQVAAHLIYEGLVEEGLTIVSAIRDRHDGRKRNPFDEPECGHYYARALASWSVLLALTGQRYSAVKRELVVLPAIARREFASLVTLGEAWGMFRQKLDGQSLEVEVEVLGGGSCELETLQIAWPGRAGRGKFSVTAKTDGVRTKLAAEVQVEGANLTVRLREPLSLRPGQVLKVRISRRGG